MNQQSDTADLLGGYVFRESHNKSRKKKTLELCHSLYVMSFFVLMRMFSVLFALQVQARGPQADPASSARSLRGPVLPDLLKEAEPDLSGSRPDLLQGQTLAGSAETDGSRLQVGSHQGTAGEIKWYVSEQQ